METIAKFAFALGMFFYSPLLPYWHWKNSREIKKSLREFPAYKEPGSLQGTARLVT